MFVRSFWLVVVIVSASAVVTTASSKTSYCSFHDFMARHQTIYPPLEVKIGDLFGFATAVSGDTLAVGAPYVGSDRHGAVYIYQWKNNRSRNVTTSLPEENDPDISTTRSFRAKKEPSSFLRQPKTSLANNHTNYETNSTNAGGAWVLQQKLSLGNHSDSVTAQGRRVRVRAFGSALAMEGNVLVVGAPRLPFGNNDDFYELNHYGRVYVYNRRPQESSETTSSSSSWVLQEELYPEPCEAFCFRNFGAALALHGDTLVATAPDGSPHDAAYIFERRLATELSSSSVAAHKTGRFSEGSEYHWTLVGNLTKWDETDKHFWRFGDSLALKDNRLVIGHNSWAAYMFQKSSTSGRWEPALKILPNDGSDTYGTGFGRSVALAGEDQVLVSAPFAGQIYSFLNNGQSFHQCLTSEQQNKTVDIPYGNYDVQFGSAMIAKDDLMVASWLTFPYARGNAIVFVWHNNAWYSVGTVSGLGKGDLFASQSAMIAIDTHWVAIGATQDFDDYNSEKGRGYVTLFHRKCSSLSVLEYITTSTTISNGPCSTMGGSSSTENTNNDLESITTSTTTSNGPGSTMGGSSSTVNTTNDSLRHSGTYSVSGWVDIGVAILSCLWFCFRMIS
jgi:hypothetical protein